MTDAESSRGVRLVVVGSIGLDTIETRFAKRDEILGGSVSYACMASQLFAPSGMVGVVGDDFPETYTELYQRAGIDLAGLQRVAGRTFRWSGVYEDDMINRRTLSTELNVFETFLPELPETYRQAPFFLLGNISPGLQLHVLNQAESPRFVAADTMNLWIDTARDELQEVISRVHLLTLNDEEARLLTGKHNLLDCADDILAAGPQFVVIKKGEHGAMLLGKNGIFLAPAFPVRAVCDPTGAGDSFAGGFMGMLARDDELSDNHVRRALLYGSVVASFGVEAFSLDRLQALTHSDVEARLDELRRMTMTGLSAT